MTTSTTNTKTMQDQDLLKVIEVKPVPKVRVERDEYLPVSVGFGRQSQEIPLFWRPTDDDHLLQVELHPDGRIQSLSTPQVPDWEQISEDPEGDAEHGWPRFDTTGWPGSGFRDIHSTFRLRLGPSSVRLTWSESQGVHRIRCGPCLFELNAEHRWVGLWLDGLHRADLARIREILQHRRNS
jgi:hypothetical protein